jgi:hypothetical protein
MHVPILCLAVVEVLCEPCGGAGRGPRSCTSGKLMAQALAAAAFLGVVVGVSDRQLVNLYCAFGSDGVTKDTRIILVRVECPYVQWRLLVSLS